MVTPLPDKIFWSFPRLIAASPGQPIIPEHLEFGDGKGPFYGEQADESDIADAGIGVITQKGTTFLSVHIGSGRLKLDKFSFEGPSLQFGSDHQNSDAPVFLEILDALAQQEISKKEVSS